MKRGIDKNNTFIVKIMNIQNSTWQGSINWVEGEKTQCFRSALEMIKLIDGALEEADDTLGKIEEGGLS